MPEELDFLRDARLSESILLKQLKLRPVTDVYGIIGKEGGSHLPKSGMVRFRLDNWRFATGDLFTKRLWVRGTLSIDQFDLMKTWMHAYSVIHIQARVAVQNITGRSQAIFTDIVAPYPEDLQLNSRASYLRKPVLFEDPQLGVFEWDYFSSFCGEAVWNGNPIKLRLDLEEDCNPIIDSILTKAKTFIANQQYWDSKIRNLVFEEFLKVKNSIELTGLEDDFIRENIKFDNLSFYNEGDFHFTLSIQDTHIHLWGNTSEGLINIRFD